MKIGDCMKRNVFSIPAEETVAEAARVFVDHHIGVLPVVNNGQKPIGILRLSDLLALELPDFVNLIADLDFVHDFGAVETTRPAPELLARPVTSLMQPVTTVGEDSGLLRAYSLMIKDDLHDIPVTDSNGVLVGIASRVDVATAVLSYWQEQAGADR
ncbi:MAG: CBS domain-containing protein [Anaerolineales bacterium]|nr:CBS domain-containing protein [Anaerolineales bacterium]